VSITDVYTSTPLIRTSVYPHVPIAVTGVFMTLTFSLSRSSELKPIGPASQFLPYLTYFTSKSMILIFDPGGHPRSNLTAPIESPWVLRINGLEVQPRICHRFRDISSQNFHTDLLTLVGLTPGPKFTKRGDDLLPT